MSRVAIAKFKESKSKPSDSDMMKAIILENREILGDEPTEKEEWLLANNEKTKVVLFHNLVSKAPREYAEPIAIYFVAIGDWRVTKTLSTDKCDKKEKALTSKKHEKEIQKFKMYQKHPCF